MTITESELKRIKKEKNSVWTFSIPAVVPPLDKEVAEAWTKMVEYWAREDVKELRSEREWEELRQMFYS